MTRNVSESPPLQQLVTQLRSAVGKTQTKTGTADQYANLIAALNGAVTLEFATIPTYLAALWTIKDERHDIANSLRNILQEEMLHLALVCNMLVSIGGVPQISSAVPTYPGKLPLGVHPKLTVPLGRFSLAMLEVFKEIERPKTTVDQDLTIGELYEEILATFKALKPNFSQDHQITGPLSWRSILSLEDVEEAIEIITTQGEGSTGNPQEYRNHLAHYYRFDEMSQLKRYELDKKTRKWSFATPIQFDFDKDVWPMADVPEGGYKVDAAKEPEIDRLLRGFNLSYSTLLDCLQAAWSGVGGQAMILRALEAMFDLEKFAKPLLQIERPDGKGTYGPDFRYISQDQR
jgi:rubrerythrin